MMARLCEICIKTLAELNMEKPTEFAIPQTRASILVLTSTFSCLKQGYHQFTNQER